MAKESTASVVKRMQAKYGETAIGFLGHMPTADVVSISTDVADLDMALGVGGIPLGRIMEVYGPEGAGKTTVCLAMIASAQRKGKLCAFIDVEHALDPKRAQQLGVNLENLLFSQPDTAEEALNMVQDLADSGEVSIIVIDSVAALTPQDEQDAEIEKQYVGVQARLMSKSCRKLKGTLHNHTCTAIFINQIREKVGVMFGDCIAEVKSRNKAGRLTLLRAAAQHNLNNVTVKIF